MASRLHRCLDTLTEVQSSSKLWVKSEEKGKVRETLRSIQSVVEELLKISEGAQMYEVVEESTEVEQIATEAMYKDYTYRPGDTLDEGFSYEGTEGEDVEEKEETLESTYLGYGYSYGYIYDEDEYGVPARNVEAYEGKEEKAIEGKRGADEGNNDIKGLGDWGWNEEAQRALESQDFIRLYQVAHDFQDMACSYGKVILSEMHLPVSEKTIKPSTSLGGHAGGDKFVARGLMFKVVKDKEVNSGYIYGGKVPRIDLAAKSASQELKVIDAFYKASRMSSSAKDSVCIPLQVMVDYAGHRLLCMPILPVSPNTLIYGGDNKRVFSGKTHPEVKQRVDEASKQLGLATHLIKGTTLMVAADEEIHMGNDNRAYLLDCARGMPPQDPMVSKHLRFHRNAIFFRMFRPEFVKLWMEISGKGLSTDALSGFSIYSTDCRQHNAEVKKATEYLVSTHIPSVAKQMDSGMVETTTQKLTKYIVRKSTDLEEGGREEIRAKAAAIYARTRGVNAHHFGLLRHHCRNQLVRQALAVEIFARSLKSTIRKSQRKTLEACGRRPSTFRLAAVTAEKLTAFLKIPKILASSKSFLTGVMRDKFGHFELDVTDSRNWRNGVILRCLSMLNVRLSRETEYALRTVDMRKNSFVIDDFEDSLPRARGLGIASLSKAFCYWYGQGGHGADLLTQQRASLFWMQAAAKHAPHAIAHCTQFGLGPFQQDLKGRFQILLKLANLGDIFAAYKLGVAYEKAFGVKRDYKQAFKWYEKAAAKGHVQAMDHIGNCHDYGKGTEKDQTKAIQWYSRAAKKGFSNAQKNYGLCLMAGAGVDKDQTNGFFWLLKAAEQGEHHAQEHVASCYEKGMGVAKDIQKANIWRSKAKIGKDLSGAETGPASENSGNVPKISEKILEASGKVPGIRQKPEQKKIPSNFVRFTSLERPDMEPEQTADAPEAPKVRSVVNITSEPKQLESKLRKPRRGSKEKKRNNKLWRSIQLTRDQRKLLSKLKDENQSRFESDLEKIKRKKRRFLLENYRRKRGENKTERRSPWGWISCRDKEDKDLENEFDAMFQDESSDISSGFSRRASVSLYEGEIKHRVKPVPLPQHSQPLQSVDPPPTRPKARTLRMDRTIIARNVYRPRRVANNVPLDQIEVVEKSDDGQNDFNEADYPDTNPSLALIKYAHKGNIEQVKHLVEVKKANVFEEDKGGHTARKRAILAGKDDVASYLEEKEKEIRKRDDEEHKKAKREEEGIDFFQRVPIGQQSLHQPMEVHTRGLEPGETSSPLRFERAGFSSESSDFEEESDSEEGYEGR
ncbi:hypothetical protein AAMO2058_001132800 [Amorphochlora amoebiformis]